MFGQTYQYRDAVVKASEGVHEVRLSKVYERSLKGYNVLTFEFEIIDEKADVPKSFDVFDCPVTADTKQKEAFNHRLSNIVRCFGLKGQFAPSSYQSWVGLTGKVRIKQDGEGFMNVVAFEPQPTTQEMPLY